MAARDPDEALADFYDAREEREMARRGPHERALDTLAALLEAVTQAGPDAKDLDVDYDALAGVIGMARTLLYEAGRLDV